MPKSGDMSKPVGSAKQSKGPMATKSSMAKRPRGKPVMMKGGAKAYHHKTQTK